MFRTVPPSIIRSFSLYTQQWYMSYRFADSLRSCSQAVSKPLWHIILLCVQWETRDDGQRNCLKHVEFYSKNKFEKLVHLVGFIIRIYHYVRLPERHKKKKSERFSMGGWRKSLCLKHSHLSSWKRGVLVLTSVHHFVPCNTSLSCNFIHREQFHAFACG